MSSAVDFAVSLLIIDDSPSSLELLTIALAPLGLDIFTASSAQAGLDLFYERRPEIVLTDLLMPQMSGLEVLKRIIVVEPATCVILMTAQSSSQTAIEAIRQGASDYMDKPVSIGLLRKRVTDLLDEGRKRKRALQVDQDLRRVPEFDGIIGRSPPMAQMFSRIQRVAPHYRALLITGETGTGKDLVARAAHRLSPVASGSYVVLNCSAVVETLFESELFGHVKGSFTGATQDKPGLFEHAHRGTLFLDEIGDMPLSTQSKLLRVLQNQEVQRVGALNARKVEVRVIAATNHDLRAAIVRKTFREDLYYRLCMVEIQTPRLADCMEDLPLLERFFVARFAAQYGKQIQGFTPRAQNVLSQHSWPGNVRELENVIGYASMMAIGNMLEVEDLPTYLQVANAHSKDTEEHASSRQADALEGHERMLIVQALEKAGGNQTQAARILRITRDRLRYKLKKHHLGARDSGQGAAAAG